MKLTSAVLSLIFAATLLISCKQNTNNPPKKDPEADWYLTTDVKPDSIYPAAQRELQIPSSGSTMYAFEYVANGAGPHPTIVLMHGLPGNERQLDLAQNLRRAGYNVFYFNYRGTWGSKGTFGFANAISDAAAVLDFLCDSLNRETLRVDTSRIAFIGHSMGAGLAMISGLKDPRVKAVASLSLFNPYTLLQGREAKGTLIGLKEYLLTLGMLKCDPNTFLVDLLKHVKEYDVEQMISTSHKPMLVIDEHQNNNYLDSVKNKQLDFKIWNTDHAFTNQRIALSREMKRWLDRSL